MRNASCRQLVKVETNGHVHMIYCTRRTYLETCKEFNESTSNINDRELLELHTKKNYRMFARYEDYYERIRFINSRHRYPKYK